MRDVFSCKHAVPHGYPFGAEYSPGWRGAMLCIYKHCRISRDFIVAKRAFARGWLVQTGTIKTLRSDPLSNFANLLVTPIELGGTK